MVSEYEQKINQFYADTITSSDTLRITIPKKTVEGCGLIAGQKLRVWFEIVEDNK